MPAPRGSSNGKAAWYVREGEEKIPISARAPKSIAQQLQNLLKPGESKSDFIVAAIVLFIKFRKGEIKLVE